MANEKEWVVPFTDEKALKQLADMLEAEDKKIAEQYRTGRLSEIRCFDYGEAMAFDDNVVPVQTFNQVAQAGHFAAGLAVIWGSVVLFEVERIWIPMLILALVAGLKEFWYDSKYETPTVRGSNLEDWLFYQIGSVTAVLVTVGVSWLRVHAL